jgi:hypothetical protein
MDATGSLNWDSVTGYDAADATTRSLKLAKLVSWVNSRQLQPLAVRRELVSNHGSGRALNHPSNR